MKKSLFLLMVMSLALISNATIYEVLPTEPETSDNIRRAIRDKAVAGDTIMLTNGEYAETQSVTLDKANLVIMAKEGTSPIIKASSYFKLYATTKISGVVFDGQSTAEYTIYAYENTAKSLVVENCEIKNYLKYNITQGSDAHTDSITINNCIFHDNARCAVYVPASSLADNVNGCNYFKMTNSTVYNVGNYSGVAAIDIRENASAYATSKNEFIVDHVTLYNYATAGNGGIMSYKSGNAKITNCIIANPSTSDELYATYCYAGTVITNNCLFNTKHHSGPTISGDIVADPLFINPAAGDFNLQSTSPVIGKATDGTNLGDPRWTVAKPEFSFIMANPTADVTATDLYTITWSAVDPNGNATITLEYSLDDETWTTIANGIASSVTTYDWNIRAMAAGVYSIRGTMADSENTQTSVAAGKLTIAPDTEAPRAIDNLSGIYGNGVMTLTWENPTENIPFDNNLPLGQAEVATTKAEGATATIMEEDGALKVDFSITKSWEYAGPKFVFDNANNMTGTIEFMLKGSANATMTLIVEQDGFDWWSTDISLNKDEFTQMSFASTDLKFVDWHNNSKNKVYSGKNVTALYLWVTYGSETSGTYYIKDVNFEGIIPAAEDYVKTVIVRAETEADATLENGVKIYEGTASTCVDDKDFDSQKTYYYAAYAFDDLDNVSEAATFMFAGIPSALINIVPSATPTYYDLLGRQTNNLSSGNIYIVVTNSEVKKVFVP